MSYKVRTQAFSGPFDLLLQLVTRQKVTIGSIAIAEVANQYLAEVVRMRDLDLDVASDFVLVASTLLDIKAASLVPEEPVSKKDEWEEDEEDDFDDMDPDEAREVLIARLIAYKQFRGAAAALAARSDAESRMHPRTVGADPEFLGLMPDYLEGISLRSLAVICADIDSKRETFLLESEHIAPKRLPVALTIASVDRLVRGRGHVTFTELVGENSTPEVVVANFLAILELYKRGLVRVSQSEVFGEIDVDHIEGADAYKIDETALAELDEATRDLVIEAAAEGLDEEGDDLPDQLSVDPTAGSENKENTGGEA